MPHDFSRARRVGEQIRRELAGLLHSEINEPDLGMLSISDVRVSPELSQARIYISILHDDAQAIDHTMRVLRDHSGRLRSHLARRMRIRAIPRLEFIHDDLIERGAGLNLAIENAVQRDRQKAMQYSANTEQPGEKKK